ncbi:single-stranded DNA-binding protein [Nocardia sp. NPDC058499]|uniref:single-stranded DNA-binding protein n=1 Tax=Nocardia sp. NPDC058499 TaxID=3346530 RepID=UPI003654F6E6
MQGDTTLTVIGNLTADPELRFTPTGIAVANFTVASTPRYFDRAANEFKDAEPLFLRCTAWRDTGENLAESLTRGARVILSGRLKQRRWQTPEGDNRSTVELEVDELGPSLRYATATVQRTNRRSTNRDATAGAPEAGSAQLVGATAGGGDAWGGNAWNTAAGF